MRSRNAVQLTRYGVEYPTNIGRVRETTLQFSALESPAHVTVGQHFPGFRSANPEDPAESGERPSKKEPGRQLPTSCVKIAVSVNGFGVETFRDRGALPPTSVIHPSYTSFR